jgi:hypothetical protein
VDAELIPEQGGEVHGRVRRPMRQLAEAERLRVELDRAAKIGDGDSRLTAVESNHGYSPTDLPNTELTRRARVWERRAQESSLGPVGWFGQS